MFALGLGSGCGSQVPSGRSGGRTAKLPPQGPWGYESKAVPRGCWWRRVELGVHILASLPSPNVSDSKPWRVGAQTRREGVWGRVGERSSGCSRATGMGLGETELGKWSGEMPGAEVSPGRPRDSRWPGRGEDGRLARAGGSRPPSESPPRPPSPGHSTLLGPALPRLGFPPPAEFRSSPGRLARRSPHRRQPRPRARGSHLGAGAGPAHRPEQQQRQAERPRDAGHGGALSTGPSLPPAARRAPRSPGRAGGRGGGAGAGPPRPQEGPGGSWLSNPGRRGSPGRSFSYREVPGTALRVGALGFGARRSRAVLIPHADHLPNPSAKESQTAPKLSRVPPKGTGAGEAHGTWPRSHLPSDPFRKV